MNKRLVPKLRFPEFDGEWIVKCLNELSVNGFSNGVFNDPQKVGKGYRLINVKDMYVGDKIDIDSLSLVDIDEKEFNKNKIEYGDILFTRSSLVKEGIAHSNVNLSNAPDLTYDGHLIRMRPNQELSNSSFLAYCFTTSNARKQFIVRGKTTTMTTIGQEDIASVKIILPSLPEQTKIADFLTAVDDKIQQLTRKKDLLEQYKKGVMQQIFSQKIRFKDDNGSDYPAWEEKKLGDIAAINTGSSNRIDSSADNGKYTFFDRSQDIRTSDIYLFDCEAVIVAGEGQEFIPKYFTGKFDLHQRTYAITDFRSCYGKYIYYVIYQNRNYLYSQAVGSTVKSLRLPMFIQMNIILPSLLEQKKVMDFLTVIDKNIGKVSLQLQQTQIYKNALLQQMFI